ncbi:MAG: phosphoribosylglycinamide formyltransferase [Candidatus Mcinerneyibacterium aminivorans]|uniref:Phosphoribosylglycinamide formyltransferase n=1 Tax=Candidatus Mcinerneyibacterium aminivorans TaxID=2703815 RepID=A0A5D0MJ42_9BACT|nr:MAG: phosphoribosylglycinamide formyltransferase [Candidatus Mcinerneyibacterium aminivorans]
MERSIAVLLSGSGRTLENILDKIENLEVSVVISSKNGVRGIEVAKKNDIPCHVIQRKNSKNIDKFSERITETLEKYNFSLIVMAGFLSFYNFPGKYKQKIMNIHPALIPSFCGRGYYGMKVHREVYKRGVKISGCTVHFVDKKYDHGPIIIQKACQIKAGDQPEDIARKVFELEKKAYPEAINLYLNEKLTVTNNKVFISD